jgi:RNAse (barnase) inhibitor barstar
VTIVRIPGERITNWQTFHDVFADALGFPDFYGRNMNAWIDCLGYADDLDAGMMRITVAPGEVLTLQIEEVNQFARRCPAQYEALIECATFVNWRRIQVGERPIIALSFYKTPPR